MEVFSLFFAFIKATWWFITPLILFFVAKNSWLYWVVMRVYLPKLNLTLLEIKIPKEVLKTPKAMEYVLVALHGVWESLNNRDIWLRGEILPWFSLEMAGTAGEMHFYIQTQTKYIALVESAVYSQYPDAEIIAVEDYTNAIPPDIPNKNWDLWGTDMRLQKESPYPLRTYVDFEEMVEERRLDPVASIAEAMNKLRVGEHLWIQFIITPDLKIGGLRKEGEKITAKLMQRPDTKERKGLASVASVVFEQSMMLLGKQPDEKKKEDVLWSPEWNLSPGEREIIKAVEQKTSKVSFLTMIRFLYIGRRDVFKKPNVAAPFAFFEQFNTFNLNRVRLNSRTYTKNSFLLFRGLRNRFRKIRLFQWYKWRSDLPGSISPFYFLNVEELATMFHFPGQIVQAPTMPRVETRKAPPPSGLPIE